MSNTPMDIATEPRGQKRPRENRKVGKKKKKRRKKCYFCRERHFDGRFCDCGAAVFCTSCQEYQTCPCGRVVCEECNLHDAVLAKLHIEDVSVRLVTHGNRFAFRVNSPMLRYYDSAYGLDADGMWARLESDDANKYEDALDEVLCSTCAETVPNEPRAFLDAVYGRDKCTGCHARIPPESRHACHGTAFFNKKEVVCSESAVFCKECAANPINRCLCGRIVCSVCVFWNRHCFDSLDEIDQTATIDLVAHDNRFAARVRYPDKTVLLRRDESGEWIKAECDNTNEDGLHAVCAECKHYVPDIYTFSEVLYEKYAITEEDETGNVDNQAFRKGDTIRVVATDLMNLTGTVLGYAKNQFTSNGRRCVAVQADYLGLGTLYFDPLELEKSTTCGQ